MSIHDRSTASARAWGAILMPLALCGLGADGGDLPSDVFAPAIVKTPASMTELAVYPPEVQLTTARDRQSIVVQATYADGITRDATKEATFEVGDPKLVRRDGATFHPSADGTTTLAVSFGGRTVTVPLKVTQAAARPPLSFRLDVMPVFMRAGCNTGSSHGAARGKDGFRISLFGFDPAGDHFRLTREMIGRRVNQAVPSDSTLLEKSTGAVPHTGGKRFEAGSELYRTIHGWIEAGAPNGDVSKLPKIVGVDLYPRAAVLDGAGATHNSPSAPDTPTAPTATSPPWPSSSRTTTCPRRSPRMVSSPPDSGARRS